MAKSKKDKKFYLEDYDDYDENEDYENLHIPASWLPEADDWGNGFFVKDGTLISYEANAKDVVIPEGVTALKKDVFSGKNIHTLTIPKSLTSISGNSFHYCFSFEKISVTDGHPVFRVADNCLIDIEKKTLVMGLNNGVIPADGSVEKIAEDAFVPNGWGRINNNIPDTVTELKPYAFAGCSFANLVIPSSVKKIGKGAFAACEQLETIVLPEGITEISDDMFFQCRALKSIKIPESVKRIGDKAFYQCENLESVNFPADLSEIGLAAFYWCNKWCKGFDGHLFIPKNLHIASGSFPCEGVESITVEEGNPYYYSEDNCVIEAQTKTLIFGCKNSVIPPYVKKIGALAFYYCTGLKNVIIPDSVEEIGAEAFEYCTDLTSVVIPESVKEIGNRAFYCRQDFRLPLQLKKVTTPQRFANKEEIFENSYRIKFIIK